MNIQMVLLPVFVQVGLTFALLFWMAATRTGSLKRGEAKMRDIALRQPAWPAKPTQVGNCYQSQLELPLLFYVLVIFAWITRQTDLIFLVMAWIFVVSRLVHAYIHPNSNHVPAPFNAFAFCSVILP